MHIPESSARHSPSDEYPTDLHTLLRLTTALIRARGRRGAQSRGSDWAVMRCKGDWMQTSTAPRYVRTPLPLPIRQMRGPCAFAIDADPALNSRASRRATSSFLPSSSAPATNLHPTHQPPPHPSPWPPTPSAALSPPRCTRAVSRLVFSRA